jgi:hypothetical protein
MTEVLVGEDFTDAVLTEQEWEASEFERCDFSDADMSGLVTRNCVFTECTFTSTDLSESRHRATAFRGCQFDRTNFLKSTWDGCSLLGSGFTHCRLRTWTLRETDLTLVGMGNADLRELDLRGIRFREANLSEADLRRCDLREADLSGAGCAAPGSATRTCGTPGSTRTAWCRPSSGERASTRCSRWLTPPRTVCASTDPGCGAVFPLPQENRATRRQSIDGRGGASLPDSSINVPSATSSLTDPGST